MMDYTSKYKFSDWSLLILMAGLIVFGTHFSKFQVIGPVYLHDLVLVSLTIVTLLINKIKISFVSIILLIGISLMYLVYSLMNSNAPLFIIVRQYSLFGYLLLYYLLFCSSIDNSAPEKYLHTIKSIGIISVVLQAGYICYLLIAQSGIDIFQNYNYISSGVIFGLIVAAAYCLVFLKQIMIKSIALFTIMFLSFTTGHSSAFLSVFTVLACYLLLSVTPKSRLIIIILVITGIVTMILALPQFQDANASWRLMLWGHVLTDSVATNWGIIGHGFGVPYVSKDFAFRLYKELGSTGFFDPSRPDEVYLSAMHNSFLTIAFAIGLLPMLLILVPFLKALAYLTRSSAHRNNSVDFIVLSLGGSSVWVSFNVILELPHSAGIYWYVYFVAWFGLNNIAIFKKAVEENNTPIQ